MKPVGEQQKKSMERLVKFSKKEERESLKGIIEYYISTLEDSQCERLARHYLNMVLKTIGYPQKLIEHKPDELYDGGMKTRMNRREQDIRNKYNALSKSYTSLVKERNELQVQLENLQFLFEKLSAKKTKDILEVIHRRKIKDVKDTV